jgi:hypothetical protein
MTNRLGPVGRSRMTGQWGVASEPCRASGDKHVSPESLFVCVRRPTLKAHCAAAGMAARMDKTLRAWGGLPIAD